jgi:NAD+ synthase
VKGSEEKVSNQIVQFIRRQVNTRKADCVVIGISGGLDSAVAASLAVRALGPDKVFGLVLPDSAVTPKKDTRHAVDLVKQLKMRHKLIELKDVKRQLLLGLPRNKLAIGNLLVRLRMILLYYHASILNGLVLGTGDKSELSLGYFTKHGDGAADLLPIGNLYKTEVRAIAKYLNVPTAIINKKSSARLWKGHTAEGEIGLSYNDIDLILKKWDRKLPLEPRLKKKAVRISKLMEKNRHKQEMPITCKIMWH